MKRPGKQAQTWNALRVGFELLLDARRDVELLRDEQVGDGWRSRRVDHARLLQLAAEEQVIRAALADRDAHAFAVHVFIALQGRVGPHQVRAFDDDVRRRLQHVLPACRVDRDKGDVPRAAARGFDDLACGFESDQFQAHTQARREFARQVDRHAARLARGWVPRREDRVAVVDRCAQRAAGGELGACGGGWRGSGAGAEQRGSEEQHGNNAAAARVRCTAGSGSRLSPG